jgi:putative NADPH-quinone reductase
MNILIVTAHPSPFSTTQRIAKTYAEAKRMKNHAVQVVDLYADEYKIDPLRFIDIKDFIPSKLQLKFQEQLLWADEIVVVHPIWWGTPPSIMKSWVELTFWPKVAYSYASKNKVNKLLIGKTAKIFVTSGGPSWYHHFHFMPLLSFWKTCIFEFSGVDVIDVKIYGNINTAKKEDKEKHIEKFLKKIKNS